MRNDIARVIHLKSCLEEVCRKRGECPEDSIIHEIGIGRAELKPVLAEGFSHMTSYSNSKM